MSGPQTIFALRHPPEWHAELAAIAAGESRSVSSLYREGVRLVLATRKIQQSVRETQLRAGQTDAVGVT